MDLNANPIKPLRPIALKGHELSDEALSLSAACLAKLAQLGKPRFLGVIYNQVPLESYRTKFYLVEIRGAQYWADTITGSLYDQAGRCASSNNLSLKESPRPENQVALEEYSLPLAA